jgi:hypothetical protein
MPTLKDLMRFFVFTSSSRFAGLPFFKLTSFAKKTGSIPNREAKAYGLDDTSGFGWRKVEFAGIQNFTGLFISLKYK